MKWDDFKNRFRKDIQQQDIEVDVDSIWNAIESDVDVINKKKKRRFFFWIFFLGIGLISGIGFFVFSNKNYDALVIGNVSFESKEEIIKSKQSIDNQAFKNGKNNDSIVESSSIEIEKNRIITTKKSQGKPNPKPNFKYNKINNKSFTNESNDEAIENKNEIIIDNTGISQTEIIESKEPVRDFSKNKKAITFKQKEDNSQFDSPTIPSVFLSLNNFNSKNPTIDISERWTTSFYKKELEKEWKSKKKNGNNFGFSTEVFGGLSFVNRKIAAKDPISNDLLNIRKNNEYTMEASHAGLLIKFKTRKGIYFSSGIQRTAIAERYEYNDTQISVDSVLGVKTLRVNLTGDTIPKMGMIPETTTLDLEKKIFNTYQLFDIPFFVGYETRNKNWQFGIEAGILANISLETEGIIPNETFEDINIKNEQDEIFKSKVGLSYHLGLTASKKIHGNWWFTIAPSLRVLPSDITKETYGLSQKYTLFGARVGVRYNF